MRGAFLKNWSANQNCIRVFEKGFRLRRENAVADFDRKVPTHSNPSDKCSREEVSEYVALSRTSVEFQEVWRKLIEV